MCHFILYSVQGFSSLPTFPVTNIHVWFPPISSLISSFNRMSHDSMSSTHLWMSEQKSWPSDIVSIWTKYRAGKKNKNKNKKWKGSENFTFLNSCRRDSASYPNSLHKHKKNKWKVNSIWQYNWDSHMPQVTVVIWEERMNIELSSRECLPKINHTIIDKKKKKKKDQNTGIKDSSYKCVITKDKWPVCRCEYLAWKTKVCF